MLERSKARPLAHRGTPAGRRVRAEWAALPPLTRAGVIVMAVGAVGDVIAHAAAPSNTIGFTPLQQAGHLAVLIGMVYTLAGIVLTAFPSRPRRPPTAQSRHIKGGPHAHR